MTTESWSSVPWTPVSRTTPNQAWHKRFVPYTPNVNSYLQTLHIWVATEEDKPPTSLASQTGPWIIYIHGGAWRDPLVDASSLDATALELLRKGPAIGGIASINYRLSPHPDRPAEPGNLSRTAKHPDHISDVLTGLAYLQSLGVAKDYVLAGHSCGATLAFQVLMNPSRWNLNIPVLPKKPRVVVGLNGLYDLAAFIRQPDESHKALAPAYEAFTRGAFSNNEAVWAAVCPSAVKDWAAEWPEGGRVVLVQSHEDTLVPYSQLQLMMANLSSSRVSSNLAADEMLADGDHNELWQKGVRLAEILGQLVHETRLQREINQHHAWLSA